MDPNSANQIWSRWTATVTTPTTPSIVLPTYEQVKENCARFYKKAFGSSSEMQIVGNTAPGGRWVIDCRTEGHPAHDPTYVAFVTQNLRAFLQSGFGQQSKVTFDVKIEAGSKQDGKPADQLIIGPEPVVLDNRLLRERPRDQNISGAKPVVLVNKLQEK